MHAKSGIEILPISIPMPDNRVMTIHPTLLWDENSLVLVDTGMPGMLPSIAEQIAKAGFAVDRLSAVVLTHQDIDHIGSLPQIAGAHAVEVYAHAADKPYIEGELPLIKFTPDQRAGLLQSLPPQTAEQFERYYAPGAKIVSHALQDGDTLPFGGGVTVIHTPGHTPGHISLYHTASQTLIAGDAMVMRQGQLQGPNPPVTPDMDEAIRSLAKLAAFDIRKVVCYHGGVFEDGPNRTIAQLAASGPKQD
ncbi:MBL fold metallo-hydrolase [Cohnella thermotolerans]|uniref:MBL fold metallo-hydrolase n=1 Tax=Cohnella thermotolerans TaxID=329858 RepID=UPI000417F7AF|nr:MBL fold metallo-hydrolase [Cohnella thermotolerans]